MKSKRAELASFKKGIYKVLGVLIGRLDQFEERVCALVKLKDKGYEVNNSIVDLQKWLSQSEHLNHKNGESPIQIVISLAQKICVNLEEQDIVSAQRIGLRHRKDVSGDNVQSLRITQKQLWEELLKAARAPNEQGDSYSIITRSEGAAKDWRCVWTKDCQVKARRTQNFRIRDIKSEADLKLIFGCLSVCAN